MLVLYNANIITLDPNKPVASAVVINQDKFYFVGEDSAAIEAIPGNIPRENMLGNTILPGLTDSHIHLEYYALSLKRVNCETSTMQECLDLVSERAKNLPPGVWILGHGWNQNEWENGYGTADELDIAAPDNPVFLTHKSYHAAWANRQAMSLAGIDQNTPDPPGGVVQRDQAGNPDGILLENAVSLVQNIIPEPGMDEVNKVILDAQEMLWKMGLTGVHDFDRQRCFSSLQSLDQSGQLNLRVLKSIPLENMGAAAEVGLKSGFGNDMLKIGSIKLFVDGALGPKTAAMLDPYEHDPENIGILLLDEDQINEIGITAVQNGMALAIHAIGDRANHLAINALERIRAYETKHNLPFLRHRIEHVQLMLPDDIGRMAKLNITASMQPVHLQSDMLTAIKHWGNRCEYGYALNQIARASINLALGSDGPIEIPNPFHGIHAAITRRHINGTPGPDGWYPDQRLSLKDALHGYTKGPAYTSGMEHKLGKISAGYLADLIVLQDNPLNVSPDELRDFKPAATMVGGKWVWRNN